VLLAALTAPLLPVPGSLVGPPVPVAVGSVAVVPVVDTLVASVVSPVLCVCPCDTPVVGGSPVVVGVEAVPSVAVVTVPSVALVGPTLVAVPVPPAAVPPPSSAHPNIHAVTIRVNPRIRCRSQVEVRIPGSDQRPQNVTSN